MFRRTTMYLDLEVSPVQRRWLARSVSLMWPRIPTSRNSSAGTVSPDTTRAARSCARAAANGRRGAVTAVVTGYASGRQRGPNGRHNWPYTGKFRLDADRSLSG
jgi:hypothetical protein